jgi:hypothetical protein
MYNITLYILYYNILNNIVYIYIFIKWIILQNWLKWKCYRTNPEEILWFLVDVSTKQPIDSHRGLSEKRVLPIFTGLEEH